MNGYRLAKVRMFIEATINVEQPVERSAETQLADFVVPALDDLKEANPEVREITYAFCEQWVDEAS